MCDWTLSISRTWEHVSKKSVYLTGTKIPSLGLSGACYTYCSASTCSAAVAFRIGMDCLRAPWKDCHCAAWHWGLGLCSTCGQLPGKVMSPGSDSHPDFLQLFTQSWAQGWKGWVQRKTQSLLKPCSSKWVCPDNRTKKRQRNGPLPIRKLSLKSKANDCKASMSQWIPVVIISVLTPLSSFSHQWRESN